MISESFSNTNTNLFKNIKIEYLLNSLDEAAIILNDKNKIIFYNNIAPLILKTNIENYFYKKIDNIFYFKNLFKNYKITDNIRKLPTGNKVSNIYKIDGKDHYFEHKNIDFYNEISKNKATLYLIRDITKEIEIEILLSLEAKVDALSGLYNSKYFYEDLEAELSRCSRYEYDLSILFIDINNFKYFNDSLGHIAGDEIIKLMGKTLLNSIRKGIDTVYRYGGDEFAMILPNTPAKRATIVSNRVSSNFKNNLEKALNSGLFDNNKDNNKIDGTNFKNIAMSMDNFKRIGLSIGIAEYKKDKSPKELVNEADHAMYKVKKELKTSLKR